MATKFPPVSKVFDDLDEYRAFCVSHGYRFNPSELYSVRSNTYRLFQKFQTGKKVRNQWEIDLINYKAAQLGI